MIKLRKAYLKNNKILLNKLSFFIKFTQEFCPYNFKLTEKITPNNKSMIQAFSLIFNFFKCFTFLKHNNKISFKNPLRNNSFTCSVECPFDFRFFAWQAVFSQAKTVIICDFCFIFVNYSQKIKIAFYRIC